MKELEKLEKMKEVLKDNFKHYTEATTDELLIFGEDNGVLLFDTESAPVFNNDIVKEYNLNKVSYKEIKAFQIPPKTNSQETPEEREQRLSESLFYTLNKSGNISANVYVWQLGTNLNNLVLYGNKIEELFELLNNINRVKIDNNKGVKPFTCYIHNLAWDIEFIKYYLKDNQFTRQTITINDKTGQPVRDKNDSKCYNIIENNGAVYSANIILEPIEHIKTGKRKIKKIIKSEIEFIDSLKISDDSLETISKNYINIDPLFIKDKELINYDIVRTDRWKPTADNIKETFYLYSDIYIMKEWYNQFITPNYINQGITTPRTISDISFRLILKESYNDDILRNHYTTDHDKKRLTDRDIYERHFDLKYIYNKNSVFNEIFRDAYSGGQTTASIKYKSLTEHQTVKGISMDIVSSYPDKLVNKPLPYGRPIYSVGKYENFEYKGELYNYHFITVAFDIFKVKEEYKESQFGLFLKLGNIQQEMELKFGSNEEFNKLNISENEYLTSNIINGEVFGTNKKAFTTIYNTVTGKHESKCIIKDKKRNKLLTRHKDHKFIITIPANEFEVWTKYYNFGYYETIGNTKRIKPGVIFIDYASLKTEIGHVKDGIMYYYNLKDKYKKINPALSLNAKKVINSFYGKNCSRRERVLKEYNLNSEIIKFKNRDSYNEITYLDNKLFAVHYGAAVTSYGRIQLMETAYAIGADKFIYADTDSLKFELTKEELKERLKEINKGKSLNDKLEIIGVNTDEKRLGLFEFEYSFEDIKTVGQKKYMYKLEENGEFIVKCAGLPKEVRESIKTKSEFSKGKEFIKGQKLKVKGGYLIVDTIYNINDYILY